MTVAVTGATGFLGRALCQSLAARGDRVRAFVRRDFAFSNDLLQPVHAVHFSRLADLHDASALRAGCAGASAVVHLAARVHVIHERAPEAEAQYRAVNVDGTREVLLAAQAVGVRHVVIVSSVKAVGESNDAPWTESVVPAPTDAYGRSKLEAERLSLAFGERHGMCITVLRLPLVYGPGATANVLRLLSLVRRGWPLPLGAVRNRRSMVYRDNVVAAILSVLDAGTSAQGTFFVSDDADLSTPELVRTIGRGVGRAARLIAVPLPLLRLVGRVGDLLRPLLPFSVTSAEVARLSGSLTVDSTRLREATGFSPRITPEEGWRRTAHWFLTGEEG